MLKDCTDDRYVSRMKPHRGLSFTSVTTPLARCTGAKFRWLVPGQSTGCTDIKWGRVDASDAHRLLRERGESWRGIVHRHPWRLRRILVDPEDATLLGGCSARCSTPSSVSLITCPPANNRRAAGGCIRSGGRSGKGQVRQVPDERGYRNDGRFTGGDAGLTHRAEEF